MKYNFDEIIKRKESGSYKWDSIEREDVIPLWVADMDFKTAPCIIDALEKRVKHGIFGYTRVSDEYYKSVIDWFSRRHTLNIEKEWIIYTSGVVPAISAIIKALTKAGDKVLVQTPVYNCFFSSIRNNECHVVENPLLEKEGTFFMDFDDLEIKLKDSEIKLMLLCNPHNPAGRVWTKEELLRLGELCRKHNVIIVSDEIHCELVYPPYKYVPFASISEYDRHNSITCVSPSKAFNIAGLQIANIICDDIEKRSRIDRAININEVCDVNPFGVVATIAAYKEGEEWILNLINYLWNNYLVLKEFFRENLPQCKITKLEGTYLVWVDFSYLNKTSAELEDIFLEKGKVWLNKGTMYGEMADGFMRINIACPRKLLEEGLRRVKEVIDNF